MCVDICVYIYEFVGVCSRGGGRGDMCYCTTLLASCSCATYLDEVNKSTMFSANSGENGGRTD